VAHWLKDRGFDAYAVQGGVAALLLGVEGPADGAAVPPGGRSRALASLRHRAFRRFSVGVLCSFVGSWVEAAAFGYVVLLLGGSAATLGLIGFLNSIPNLVFALPAGILADRFDRRKLLLIFQSLNMLVPAVLAVLYASGELEIWSMGVLAVVGGSLGALSFPAFQGMLASTVPPQDLESAVAVNSLSLQVARAIGPAIAGFLLATAGATWVFAVNAVSFLPVLATLALLAPSRPARAVGAAAGSIIEAGRYVFGQRSLAAMMGFMSLAGLFCTPPVVIMIPAIVRDELHRGAATLGALTASIGVGSVIGSILLLGLSRRVNKGEPLLVAFFLTAAAVAGVGASGTVGLSLILGAVGGLAGVVYIGLSTVVVQSMSSDEMRARTIAIWAAAFVGMLPLGSLITGGLAAVLGAGGAVLVDGLAALVGGLAILVTRPEVSWLGCAALPEACIAATSPAALAVEEMQASGTAAGEAA